MKKYFSWPTTISLLLVLIPLITTTFLSFYFAEKEAYFTAFNTYEWIGFSLIGIFSQALALTPPTFCALVLGYFWGWKTLPILFLINLCSIYLINWLVKKIDHHKFVDFVERNPKAASLLKSIKTDELKIVTLTKLSPVLPFTLTNVIFALSGAKLKNILLGGFLGMIPRTLVSIWTGTQAKEIQQLLKHPNEGNLEKIALISLIFISILGLIYLINKAVKRAA